jgi:hypothetical protein
MDSRQMCIGSPFTVRWRWNPTLGHDLRIGHVDTATAIMTCYLISHLPSACHLPAISIQKLSVRCSRCTTPRCTYSHFRTLYSARMVSTIQGAVFCTRYSTLDISFKHLTRSKESWPNSTVPC